MAQGVSPGSVASIECTGSFSAGDTLTVADGNNEVFAVQLEKQAAHLVFASDSLQSKKAYTLYVNGTAIGSLTAQ